MMRRKTEFISCGGGTDLAFDVYVSRVSNPVLKERI
jgi:hypothetical protein